MTAPRTTASVELDPQFRTRAYDPLVPTDLLFDEVQQRRETGYDVDDVVREANATDPDDREAVLALVDALSDATRGGPWPYEEPDDPQAIAEAVSPAAPAARPDPATLSDRIHAAWLGRIAGCNLGKPVEWGWDWTVETIRDYLEKADAYPLRDYFPVLDPMPEGYEFRDNWPETTRGRVDGSARDDDIDYPILALHLLERHGDLLRTEHVAEAWLNLFPIAQVFTAERAAYINLVSGVPIPETARRRNPYREWIGAQIRGDVFGMVHAGDPWAAARHSMRDAVLSHVGNGIYGEMWSAALVAAAFGAESAEEAVLTSMTVLPPGSRLAEALAHVVRLRRSGHTWEAALQAVRDAYGHYAWVHTINNAAAVAVALLWSEGDYTTAVGRVVMSGWDTDSNGATVGSVMGILVGRDALPAHFVEPLRDSTRSALFGFDNSAISDLAHRTARVASELHC
ncbi:ADP-ribosylglycohydrolase family protein [Microbacterium algeriense]|uniref:ADP-ribosylglycohydrolase family protein n=1 Tax=Microbacterium algeriense TaxID=2615184 RepID=UPI0022DFD7CE|nr:ADP-ribosylglycohydrolase family protein [Microbacterium algeriense]